jgi:hypothetical protein
MKLKIEKYQFGTDLDSTLVGANQLLSELSAKGTKVVSASILVDPVGILNGSIDLLLNKNYWLLVTSQVP